MNRKRINSIFFLSGIMFLSILSIFLYSQTKQKKWTATTHDKTNFPLVGKHRTVSCGECHLEGLLKGTPTQCESCHWYRKKDDRYSLQLGIHCGECHTPYDWKKMKPDGWHHDVRTGYPLRGAHKFLDCFSCHQSKQLTPIQNTCVSCHLNDYNNAKEPDHKKAGFSTDCESCHRNDSVSWKGASINHDLFWKLSGVHRTLDCNGCHESGFNIPTDCFSCHRSDYEGAKDPNHLASGFPTICEQCHKKDSITWKGAVFNHDTIWKLDGAHKILDCNDCHSSGYNLPTDCYGCHRTDYEGTRDPNHRSAGFPTNCQLCHFKSHVSWSQAVFNHRFPINSGKHSRLDCSDCHQKANYKDFTCISCHEHSLDEIAGEHDDVGGFSYNSHACYSCHPQGKE